MLSPNVYRRILTLAAITCSVVAASSWFAGCSTIAARRASQGVVADGAQFEVVSTVGKGFGEGVVAAKDGKVYVLDVTWRVNPNPGGTIYCYDPITDSISNHMEPSELALGLHVDKANDLLIAQGALGGGRAIVRHNLTTNATTLIANSYHGKRFVAPNDITSDARGRIYFTDARYAGNEPMELPNAVYRIDLDGSVTQISTDILRPNGIEVSPDNKRLYVAASNAARMMRNPLGPASDRFGITMGGVVVYDLDDNGNVSNGRVFYRNDDLVVDGTAMDTDGNLYLALHDGTEPPVPGDIVVLRPDGSLLEHITPPPASRPSNLGFGRGSDAHSLYLTTGSGVPWRLYRIKTIRRGLYWE